MEKTALRIRKFGDPVLRKKAGLVKKITPDHRDILSGMARLMYDGEGIGLAASQVGLGQAMIVVDIGKGLYKIVNPKVVKALGTQVNLEGCLSVPGVCIKVKRANKIKVTGLDENSEPLSIEAEGLLACVFQHEIDHLKGRLIVDYASFLEKIKIARALKEIKKKAEYENLSESTKKSCKLQL
ncbi:MAG: peptide deformylase [Candidatus Omnitrophica bacterium]|nr:peptide deformylase [Candidatus Omnitrophota bacterium]MDD5662393.1 peptide deformylase [Candidatus Omnitrophota bacterium]